MSFTFLVRLFLGIFWCNFKRFFFFLTFPFSYFIVSVKKCNQFLNVNLVSCYFAESIY